MSTNSSRPQDSSILGESWVVASSFPDKEDRPSKDRPSESSSQSRHLNKETGRHECNNGSDSMTTSASSISGPELIMPSIYETPITEGSWVAPAVRSKSKAAHSLRRRHNAARESTPRGEKHDLDTSKDGGSSEQGPDSSQVDEKLARPKSASRSKTLETLIRTIINVLLVVAISHLLIIPEVVQQYQTLCTIETISTLYPASCIPPYPQPQPNRHRASRSDTLVSSQIRLEALFNTTLHAMTPLSDTLKQSESKLRDIETALKKAYPGMKHELDLEFNGCWEATRAATKKFDSLKVDIRSAVDNLIATSGATTGDAQSAAQGTRLSTQMSWREQYLDQLTARMQNKADSLSNDLATLDDHLESIGSILVREMKQSPTSLGTTDSAAESPVGGLRAFVDKLPSFFRQTADGDGPTRPDLSISELFRDAAEQHRPVVDAVRRLSSELQTLQKKRTY
ncbi:hypothetical protein ANOM_004432 [Aspergillus nomiae NRRL 13137]|uniref:Uncharacterized protein n=1 Tax=Aspergillus nomiae NRRL (strain ATCC 15546 / NRRL 13137 / CBS 260.88 / M93) TaxID=1509407 RepID=A0A0L1J7Z7_ASPN3|nr:uncharacterized protein ANOM_004432 [Aspergillus nomiae NRRL 13137]KNG87810.1 hypothetical protein ANOM_004432 [Aspergillus nomiae NRRL 13137]